MLRRGGRLAAMAVVMLGGMPSAAPGQSISASMSVGVAVPSDDLFRDIYGSAVPVALQLEISPHGRGLLAFGGIRYASFDGEAVVEGTQAQSGEAVRFRMTTGRAGVGWRFVRGPWGLALGGGPAFNFFREEWPDIDFVTDGRSFGLFVQASLSRTVSRRVSVLLRSEYFWTAASAADSTLPEANLGAVDLAAGFSYRF